METVDVIICGCGPTGALLSAYLGQQGVKNVILEKEVDITQDPRGIVLDEDGIRSLQGVGLYDRVFTEMGQIMTYFNFRSGADSLQSDPFLRFNYGSIEGGTSHPGFMCHKQPILERCLRGVIEQQTNSDLRTSSTVQMISEDEDYVYATYTNQDGEEKKLRAKYLVGADGKTGFTRKNYLEPKGIRMEKDEKFKYEEAWVALNWRITPPTRKTHPDFPLWKLGYTPEQVYDAFFPSEFTFICNPDRPSVCGRFGLREDHLWRFEFVVKHEEDGLKMAEYESVKNVVFPYLTHPKSRYNLSKDLVFPEDCIEVIRSRPFTFSARSCNKWSLGRVLLCGDAAHVFPPFGGQGIASGFRDAISVAWRLTVACQPNFNGHEMLFRGWYLERKQQWSRSLAATIENGNFCNERSAVKTFVRNWYLWVLQLVPSWRHWLELGQRRDGLMTYNYAAGMPFLPGSGGGKLFPQVFCSPYGVPVTSPVFTDDVIFAKGKKALFQLVVLLSDAKQMDEAIFTLTELRNQGGGVLRIEEATYIIDDTQDKTAPSRNLAVDNVHGIIYKEKYDQSIWGGLPEPLGYDGSRMRKEVKKRYIIIRPDRFIYAACNTRTELFQASRSLVGVFSGVQID